MNTCLFGDCRDVMRGLRDEGTRVQTCVTSPPYWGLRDYGNPGQLGLERTPEEYVEKMVEVFRLVRDLLADNGTLWLNLGDSYAANRAYQVPSTKGGPKHGPGQSAGGNGAVVPPGLKTKDLVGIPWRVAFALQADGWYLRQDIIWHKPNPMPESVIDRCTKAHEYVFLLSKSARYYYDAEAVSESASGRACGNRQGGKSGSPQPGMEIRNFGAVSDKEYHSRNRRSVWTVATQPYSGAHFATFPPALIEPMILAGSRPGDVVLDPFFGSGTTGEVAEQLGRRWLGIELNEAYAPLQQQRTAQMGVFT
ncbi:MAG TPA: site-specific DNA-methyltransferase [Thermoanaerobaculales bacterium]|nr:site-specific DNA-methyltransferase [Thermoanaerobaculales bacterium]